jgi:hypothetical protein
MIFAARRAWIEIDHIYDILKEDGYRQIQLVDVVAGDVVLYKDENEPSHVGLIVEVSRIGTIPNIKVISKWGFDPEFEHFIDDVPPRLGRHSEYYTERLR